MNYLQLCQRLHLEIGIGQGAAGSKPTTVTGQADKLLQIVTWINQAWTEIQLAQAKGAWRWMQTECTLDTVDGAQAYDIATQTAFQANGTSNQRRAVVAGITRVGQTATVTTTAAVASLTSSGTTATVTTTNPHGWSTGQSVVIAGAVQTEYNGSFTVTVTGATTATYTFAGSATSPATGTITASVPHLFETGDEVTIAGAVETAYNVTAAITVTSATEFTYTVVGTPTTPATGTPTCVKVVSRFDQVWPYTARSCEPYILGYDYSVGVTDQQPIYYTPFTDFDGFLDRGQNLVESRPVRYSINNAGRLVLWPVPDATVYRLTIPYVKDVQTLAADTDIPEMPDKFHMAIVYRAAMYYAGSTEANKVGPNFASLYRMMYRKICNEQLPDVIVGTR